jgi:hypothetical protein
MRSETMMAAASGITFGVTLPIGGIVLKHGCLEGSVGGAMFHLPHQRRRLGGMVQRGLGGKRLLMGVGRLVALFGVDSRPGKVNALI